MPFVPLTSRATGQDELIDVDQVAAALASGKYIDPGAVAVRRDGQDAYAAPGTAVNDQAFAPAIDPARAALASGHAIRESQNSGAAAGARALVGGTVSGVSAGLLSPFADEQEFHPIASGVGNALGVIAPALLGDEAGLAGALPSSAISRAGAAVGDRLGGGILARGVAGTAEGALYGAGQGTGELLRSDDPLTWERATSALSSNMLFAGGLGGGLGLVGGALERGLARAGRIVEDGAAAHAAHEAVAPDLAALDAKGLRAAETTELAGIEAGRVGQRQELATDLAAFRRDAQQQKVWLATKQATEGEAPAAAGASEPLAPAITDDAFKERQKAYGDLLTPQESRAIDTYTSSTYKDINKNLRHEKIVHGRERTIADIDSALAKSVLPERTTLYRGLDGEEAKLFATLEPGDSFLEKAYSSTSSSPDAFKRAVNLHIDVPAGYEAAPIPSRIDEKEFLLRRHTRYEVTGVEEAGEHKTIRVRVVDGGDRPALDGMVSTDTRRLPDSPPVPITKRPPAPKLDPETAREIRVVSKQAFKADRQLDNLLDNPKALAESPHRAKAALQQQEHALQQLAARSEALRVTFAADTSGARAAALDQVPALLERNRALQARMAKLAKPAASDRLAAIADARTALSMPKPEPSLVEKAASGGVFGVLTGAAAHIPLLGQIPGVAHLLGAKGAETVMGLVFGRLGKATGELAGRTKSTVAAFTGAAKAAKYAPVLATKALAAIRYAPPQPGAHESPRALPELFKARTDEIKSQTAYDAQGVPRMRPEARATMAAQLKPIRAADPILADRIETLAARRIEYLSSLIPRRPDFGTPQFGPDSWQPSDMAMRSWARSAVAVEDPHGVEERAVHGALTPEDSAAYWAVYPEQAQHFKQQVLEQLAELRTTLPYARRLSLGIFAGVPIDPSMTPHVLAALQAQFEYQPEQPPRATPQFGSVKSRDAEQGTLSQRRELGTT